MRINFLATDFEGGYFNPAECAGSKAMRREFPSADMVVFGTSTGIVRKTDHPSGVYDCTGIYINGVKLGDTMSVNVFRILKAAYAAGEVKDAYMELEELASIEN